MSAEQTSYHDYLAALAVLNLRPGADIDDVRKAYRAMMRTCHPDYFPGDAEKEKLAKAVNAAKDTLEAISEAGLFLVYAMRADYEVRRGTGVHPLVRPVVLVIIAPAGMGKTSGWAKWVARHGARLPAVLVPSATLHVILASPSIVLMEQTERDLKAQGLRPTMIHSKQAGGAVLPRLVDYYADMRAKLGQEAILLVSHAAIFDTPIPYDPENWDIVFDEMPDCVSFVAVDAIDTHYLITRQIEPRPHPENSNLYYLDVKDEGGSDGKSRAYKRLARIALNRPMDGALAYYSELARALISGHGIIVAKEQYDELVITTRAWDKLKYYGHLDILKIVQPSWFRDYRSVTMMGARCLSHLTALIWRKLWHIEFKPDDRFNLPKTHTVAQGKRMRIHYVFEERASRALLARKSKDGGNLMMAVCKSVATFYSKQKYKTFLWSAPQPGKDGDAEHGIADRFWAEQKPVKKVKAFDPALRLPGRTHGLNKPIYMKTYNVALLSIVNFTPMQLALLRALGLTDNEIDKAMAFDVAYQDLCRCNIRERDGKRVCHITVMDRATAEDIALEFPGCTIEQYPADLVPQGLVRKNGAKRGPQPSGKAKSSTERSRKARMEKARASREEQRRESG